MLTSELFEYAIIGSPVLLQILTWFRRGDALPSRVVTLIISTGLALVSLLILVSLATIPCPETQPTCPAGSARHVTLPGIAVRYEECGVCITAAPSSDEETALTLNRARAGWSVGAALASLSVNLLLLVGFIGWARKLRTA